MMWRKWLWLWERKSAPQEAVKIAPLFMATATANVTCSCCQKVVSIWRTYADGKRVCVPCSVHL